MHINLMNTMGIDLLMLKIEDKCYKNKKSSLPFMNNLEGAGFQRPLP